MSETKYIKFRSNRSADSLDDFIMVFSPVAIHADIVAAMASEYIAISAGFVERNPNPDARHPYQCYGDSTSTGLKSDPKIDDFLVSYALRGVK